MGKGVRQTASARRTGDPGRAGREIEPVWVARLKQVEETVQACSRVAARIEEVTFPIRGALRRRRWVDDHMNATAQVAALDAEGRASLERRILTLRAGGDLAVVRLIEESLKFLDANLRRRDLRYAAVEGRVEVHPRLDRLLLSTAALADTRRLTEVPVAFGQAGGKPARVYDVGISRADRTATIDTEHTLRVCDLALAYQQGLPLSGSLQYEDSGRGRRFSEADFVATFGRRGLPTRQTFADTIVL